MIKIIATLCVIALSSCAALPRNGTPYIRYEHKLDLKETHAEVEAFFGKSFLGENIDEKERAIESYFIGWSKEELTRYLSGRLTSVKVPPALEEVGDKIWLHFYFLGVRVDRYDIDRKSICFVIVNGVVRNVAVVDSKTFGLTADKL